MTYPRLSQLAEQATCSAAAVAASPFHAAEELARARARLRATSEELEAARAQRDAALRELEATRAQRDAALRELDEVAPPWRNLFSVVVPLNTVSEANSRESSFARARRVKRQRELLLLILRHTGRKPEDLPQRMRVTFTRIASRALDDDNLVSAFKACRDAVAQWLGVDDSPRGPITWAYSQEVHKRYKNAVSFRMTFEELCSRRAQ